MNLCPSGESDSAMENCLLSPVQMLLSCCSQMQILGTCLGLTRKMG